MKLKNKRKNLNVNSEFMLLQIKNTKEKEG